MLVPVIGLVQVGGQAMADRYTYLPLTGAFVALVWTLSGVTEGKRWRVAALSVAAAMILVPLAIAARAQTAHWKDGVTLFSHALRVTEKNAFSHLKLGVALSRKGMYERAFPHFEHVLRLKPDPSLDRDRVNWHVAFLLAMKVDSARQAAGFTPDEPPPSAGKSLEGNDSVDAGIRRGILLAEGGRIDEGMTLFREALRARPDHPMAHVSLGVALAQRGRRSEAIPHFEAALRTAPGLPVARYNLGIAMREEGRIAEAFAQFEEILKRNPADADAHHQLGLVLRDQGRRDQAVLHFRYALLFDPTHAAALEALRETGNVR